MKAVREVMSEVTYVTSGTSVVNVAQEMLARGTGVIAVCDSGKFLGVVTDRDITIGIVAARRDPVEVPASSLMNNRIPTISPDASVMLAADVMVDTGTRALPVVENGILVGLFTVDDFARVSLGLAALVFAKTAKLQAPKESRAKA